MGALPFHVPAFMQAHPDHADHATAAVEAFLPHGFCYLWNPQLLWTHVVADLLIGFAYVAISTTLVYLVWRGRREFPFQGMFVAFGLFIVACGATHFVEVYTLWDPVYWFSAGVKMVTAVASVGTALLLPPLVPVALNTVRQAKLSEERRVRAESAERFRTLAEGMPQIVWTAGPDGRVDYYNHRWYEYTGISVEGGHGWGWQGVLHPGDRERTVDAWTRAIRTGAPYEVEHRLRDRAGRYGWFLSRGTPIRGADGQVTWCGTGTDIDGQKRAEAEARETNQRLALLYGTASELLGSDRPGDFVDRIFRRLERELGVCVYVNFMAEPDGEGTRLRLDSYAGVPAERATECAALGGDDAVCGTVARERRRLVLDDVQASTDSGAALLRSLGITAYVCYPLLTRGRLIGTLSFGACGRACFTPDELDLLQAIADQVAIATDRAQTREAEREARAQAEEANRAKSQFLAAMSHELRTPLNAIGGYVELLEMGIHGPVTAGQAFDLGRVRVNQEHLLSLINDILQHARIEAGKLELQREEVPVGEVLAELDAAIAPQLRTAGLEYHCQAADPSLTAAGDRERIRQILLNLLANAVKFTPAGGRVTVWCEAAPGQVRVHVQDTGRGIPGAMVQKIFDPFVQVRDEASRDSSRQGVGLGLTISRDLARGMGGDLAVASTPGQGSTFTLSLPAPDVAEGAPDAPRDGVLTRA